MSTPPFSGYYVHATGWAATAGGPELSTADLDAALASMGDYYEAAVQSLTAGDDREVSG